MGPMSSRELRGDFVLVLSPDSRLLAAPQGTGIALWEVATGKVRRRLADHQGGVVHFVFSPDGRTMLTGGEDTTILIWDLARRNEPQPARLAPADLDALWRDLGGDDAERADLAIGTLVARADQSGPFLNKHLAPISAADPTRLNALIADLDNGMFAVREKAAKELEKFRDLATPALKQALVKPGSLETSRRIEDLLAKQRTPLVAGKLLQSIRAVEVLEWLDNPEARKLLYTLSTGASHARLTQEARDALNRLEGFLAK